MSDISINPVTRRVQYTGNTGLGPFAFTFNILVNTDIVAYKNSTLLTLTTDYTVTINANGTGSITLTGSGNGTALVAADILTVIGGRELSRTTDFVTAGDLLASSLNEQLDSQVIMVQQLDEKVERTMRVSPDDVYNDMTLPIKATRKGTVLAFNATTGDPEAGPTIANTQSVADNVADINTVADDIANVNTVAGNISNVNTVAGVSGNVTTVAGISGNVTTVAGNNANVTTVAGISGNVTTVATNIASVNTNAANIVVIQNASANATAAAASAAAALASEGNAATSETNAASSESAALAAKTAAEALFTQIVYAVWRPIPWVKS